MIVVNSILYRIPPQLQRSYRDFENWDGEKDGEEGWYVKGDPRDSISTFSFQVT